MNLFKVYITPYLKEYIKSIVLAIFFSVLTIATSALLAFTSGYLISRASLRPETILLLYVPIVGVRTFGISRAVFQYIERLTGHNAVLKIVSAMRVKLYEMIEPQALFIHNHFKTGDLLGTLADDIEHLQDVYIRTIFPTISALVILFMSTMTIAVFDWKFTIWILFCLCLIVFIYPIFSLYFLKSRQLNQKMRHTKQYETLTDSLFGLRDWMISRKSEQFIGDFYNAQMKINDINRSIVFWTQSRGFQLQLISGIVMVSIAIWSSNMVQAEEFAPAYIAAFTLVTLPILEGMIQVSHAVDRVSSYVESLKRIDKIQAFAHEKPVKTISIDAASIDHVNIEVNNLQYRYDQQQQAYALQNITLSVKQGEKIALLGKSGAGKSTLIQLLQGTLIPNEGMVTIGGVSPSSFGEHIYDLISVLNQKPYLFATSIENNIRLGNEHASKEEIIEVMQQVGLADYIESLPKRLETQMEETGQRFSGGERQRIALARILLKDTPIVILDEPTIGLDPLTEATLLNTIFTALKNKTVIWITHHLVAMDRMDQVIFLDNGLVTMKGSHHELIKTNKRYRQLFQMDRGGLVH
ncbi:thiol reductant ABC exporter subunit CydC [Metabacillus malikii]|uniref:ATP-binding cassette subfamily C protein CydC n=1 Tax=Metabacillus malikii TaxID=1504265 RepID=A0ABT9ZDH5_9BACI|nr:thiol reductant ABC exporter subunit CydC [Metabacillus malikii]MDQ0230070.1 ATP-binding cassette subfamily C protein CydC [Metabacillus malikii]